METELKSSFIPNPEVPCSIPIEDGLFPGRSIRMQGFVHYGVDAFWINLQNGPSFEAEDSVAFHIRFIFDESERAVRWSDMVDDEWGVEVRDAVNPLQEEVSFEIIVVCERDAFQVCIDGLPYCQFHPRLPLDEVTHLVIQGALTLTSVSFEGDYDNDLVAPDDLTHYQLSPTQEIVDSTTPTFVRNPSTTPNISPTQDISPKTQDISPKPQDIPAIAKDISPTTQDISQDVKDESSDETNTNVHPPRMQHISISQDPYQEPPTSIMTTSHNHQHALKAARSSTVAFPNARLSDVEDEELRRRQLEDRKKRLSSMRMSVQESSDRFTTLVHSHTNTPTVADQRTGAIKSDLERSKCCVMI